MTDQDNSINRTAEELLRIRQLQLALIFDNVNDVVFALNVTEAGRYRFTSVNKRFLEATGLREDAVVGKYIEEVIPPSAHALVLSKYREAIRTRSTVFWEETSVFPSGERVGEVTVAPVFDSDGQCRQLIGTVHDITEYRHMQDLLEKNEERWRLALEGSGAGVWDWDPNSRIANYSQQWKKMLGYRDGDIGSDLGEWELRIHPEDRPSVMAAIEDALKERRPSILTEHRLRQRSGRWIWVHSHGMIAYDQAGRPERMIGTITDITDRKEAEAAMQLAALFYKNSSEAMVITDAVGTIIATNDAFARSHEITQESIIGVPLLGFFQNIEGSDSFAEMRRELLETGSWRGEVWRRRKDGSTVTELCTVDSVYAQDGTVAKRILLFLDISERKAAEEVIWRQANYDALTSLPNRLMFADRLAHAVELAGRNDSSVALLIIGLDRFKEVNDALGHAAGDMLLLQAARRLQQHVREVDTIARLSGDEFAVILADADDPHVERIAHAITDLLSVPFDLDGHLAYVSASVGIAHYPRDAGQADNLIKHADQAMYAVKQDGGNGHGYFLSTMQEKALARRRMINNLHRAMAENQLAVHYQPIVNLKNGTVRKAEALLRWKHPEDGYISPDLFIPLAEEIGIIDKLGAWVCNEVLQNLEAKCRAIHSDFQISINFSPAQFKGDKAIFQPLIDFLRQTGMSGDCMVMELTEGLLLNLDEPMLATFDMLTQQGIQLALDDFGTGYSSLSYITKLNFQFLKIDRVFVKNLESSATSQALCETMIVMAHKLGIQVIAEGIETEAQRKLLTDAGCDFGQGYLFAKPMPFEDFEKLLAGMPPQGSQGTLC